MGGEGGPAAEGLMRYRFPIDRSWKHPEGDREERTREGGRYKMSRSRFEQLHMLFTFFPN